MPFRLLGDNTDFHKVIISAGRDHKNDDKPNSRSIRQQKPAIPTQ